MSHIFVVIPAFNEQNTIRNVVDSIPREVCGRATTPIVVSDASDDDTAEEARKTRAEVLEHVSNTGQGGALQTGFEFAFRSGNPDDIIVTMDGDGQHRASEINRLVKPIEAEQADYVLGSRHIGENNNENPLHRRAGIRFFTLIVNQMVADEISDLTNGFRAFRIDIYEQMTLTEQRFSAPELLIEAAKSGADITEVPVTIDEREGDTTKKPKIAYGFGLARVIASSYVRSTYFR